MSEWSIEHAWKLTPAARADAHEIPPTHFRSTTSSNNDVHRGVPVNDGIYPGFRGVCDTVLTQFSELLALERLVSQRQYLDRPRPLRARIVKDRVEVGSSRDIPDIVLALR
jgi:hypothetical protein